MNQIIPYRLPVLILTLGILLSGHHSTTAQTAFDPSTLAEMPEISNEFTRTPHHFETERVVLPPIISHGSHTSPFLVRTSISRPEHFSSTLLAEIYFDWNRDRLKADAGHIVEHTADILQQNPTEQVNLQAICDQRGTEAYSLTVGWQRISGIKEYLRNLGIPTTQITHQSYATQPVCKNQNNDCGQEDRSHQEAFRLLAMTSTRAGCFVTFSLQNNQATKPAANYSTRKPFLQSIHLAESQ